MRAAQLQQKEKTQFNNLNIMARYNWRVFYSTLIREDYIMSYNGHKNRNHWNVNLWINNDERLYRMALQAVKKAPTKDRAAIMLLRELKFLGLNKTPDGVPYSVSTIRGALVDM